MRKHHALGPVLLVALAGCAAPEVRHIGPHLEEEDGITRLQYEEPDLAPFVAGSEASDAQFDLKRIKPATSFDRIGVRWDARTNGGLTQVQVRVAGTEEWLAVQVDDEQAAVDGRTFFSGHVDVPSGAELESRVRVVKGAGSSVSPVFTQLAIEVFSQAAVEEYGEVQGGDGADAATAAPSDVPSDVMPGELAPAGGASFAVEEPTIVSRETWGARAPRCAGSTHTPYRMTFHHTETPSGERGEAAKARMRQMQAYHQNSRGWCDIGYHFVIDADGKIYRGRTTTARTAAHVANQNTGNLGVALMGSFNSNAPPEAAMDGLAATFAFLANTWNIPVNAETLRGHKQWNGQSTSCPGNPLLGLKQEILDGVKLILNDAEPEPSPMPTATPPPAGSTIVVDNDSPLFYASGNWFASTSIPTPYGANYHARSAETVSDPAYWAATLTAGDYEVLVRWTAASNRAQNAPYFVYHQGGTTTVYADQTANGSEWMTLGTYTFSGGTTDRVALSCWTASGDFVIADAVAFLPRSE